MPVLKKGRAHWDTGSDWHVDDDDDNALRSVCRTTKNTKESLRKLFTSPCQKWTPDRPTQLFNFLLILTSFSSFLHLAHNVPCFGFSSSRICKSSSSSHPPFQLTFDLHSH